MAYTSGIRVLLVVTTASVLLLGLAPVAASSANISQSYKSRQAITPGSVVSLDENTADFVEPSTTDNGPRLVGVAVAADDSLLAVDEVAGGIQVATSGNAQTLVSTLNGDIAVGDQISVSPFSGIGMKATPGSRIIGLAQTAFNDNSEGATTREVTDKTGKKTDVSVGFVSVSIAIGNSTSDSSDQNLTALQRLGKSVTGRTVSTTRIVISMIVTFVAICSLITLIYASIYGGIISIGRNPLAKYAVFRTIGVVFIMVIAITVLAGLTIYLLLR